MVMLNHNNMKNHQKKEIRTKINDKRKNLSSLIKQQYNLKIVEKLTALAEWEKAKNILIYVSHDFEVDTHQIIRSCFDIKSIIVPKTHKNDHSLTLHKIDSFDDLKKGNYHILEPLSHTKQIDPEDIDLAIIPGVAFDLKGHRIGYGKAYYDKLNRNLKCPKIGLAYNLQIVDNIPAEKHDEPVDILITENNTYHFTS